MPDPKKQEPEDEQGAYQAPIVITELEEAWKNHERALKTARHEILYGHEQDPAKRTLYPDQQDKLEEIEGRLDDERADPLLDAVWQAVSASREKPRAGMMPSQSGARPADMLTPEEVKAAAVYWMLKEAGFTDPNAPEFEAELNRRLREYKSNRDLYEKVAAERVRPGNPRRLSMREVHATVRELAGHGNQITSDKINEAYAVVSKKQEEEKRCEVSLAGVATDASVTVVPDHVRAGALVWAHARLEYACLFRALDTIIDDADLGQIAIDCDAVVRIQEYRRDDSYRWLTEERLQTLRERVLGPPFPTLMRNLVVAGHTFLGRQTQVDLVGSKIPPRISEDPVRMAATALAAHLSEQGWGTTYTAAEGLKRQIIEARKILSDPSVERAYCSRDWLGVVVRACEGTEVSDITREFTLADAGATAMSWLATKAEILSGATYHRLLDDRFFASTGGDDRVENPTDGDFIEAIEQIHQVWELSDEQPPVDEQDEAAGEQPADEAAALPEGAAMGSSFKASSGVVRLKPSMFPDGGRQAAV
jgi:hypothetical protein